MYFNSLKEVKRRINWLFLTFLVVFFIIVVRLFVIIFHEKSYFIFENYTFLPEIIDRNGNVLATTINVKSLYAHPNKIKDPVHLVNELKKILNFSDEEEKFLLEKLKSNKNFVWIKKEISESEEKEIKALKNASIGLQIEKKRVYPYKNLFSHAVGYVNADLVGQFGLERHLSKNSLNNDEKSLKITLDLRVQYIVKQELENAIKEFQAKFGACIVVDIFTGEVLAMVSLPDFDPENIQSSNSDCMINHLTQSVYEFGSVMKLFSLGACYKYLSDKEKKYDVSEQFKLGKFVIKDVKKIKDKITFEEAFLYSSNIGIARAILDVGWKNQMSFLAEIGLLDEINFEIDISGVKKPQKESKSAAVTISYGYGISVTAMHIVHAAMNLIYPYCKKVKKDSLKNFKISPFLKIIKGSGEKMKRKKISYDISSKVFEKLKEGLSSWSSKYVSGVRFVGKTGTANSIENGKYVQKKNLTSFVGFFPIESPRYIIFLMIQNPRPSKKTFGLALSSFFTLPIVRNIINRMRELAYF